MNWIVEPLRYSDGLAIANAYPEGEPANNIKVELRESKLEKHQIRSMYEALGSRIGQKNVKEFFKEDYAE